MLFSNLDDYVDEEALERARQRRKARSNHNWGVFFEYLFKIIITAALLSFFAAMFQDQNIQLAGFLLMGAWFVNPVVFTIIALSKMDN